ncbi:unnamed protein product [Closterium sp. Naga37s-1]|nr:unnamed protein product [Closterium sp. Naga37s-1]
MTGPPTFLRPSLLFVLPAPSPFPPPPFSPSLSPPPSPYPFPFQHCACGNNWPPSPPIGEPGVFRRREGVKMGDTEEKKDRRGEEGEGGEMQGQRDIETLLNKTEREEEGERGGKQGQGDATVVVVEGESSMLVLEGLVFYCQGRGGRGEGKKGGEGGEGGFSGAGVKNARAGVESCYTRVEVDVCAWVNLAAAAQSDELQDSSDELQDSVDYGEIYTIARRHVESHQPPPLASLALPPLAHTIATTIRTSLPRVKRVWVRLAAPAPASLSGAVGCAAAQITL